MQAKRLTVEAVPGRLFPSGRVESWIGWSQCADGRTDCPAAQAHGSLDHACVMCGYEPHEHLLPRGTGPGDSPAVDYIVTDAQGQPVLDLNKQPIRRSIPERITGRTIRLRRCGPVEVADIPVIRKAIADGDLAPHIAPAPLSATPEQIAASAENYTHTEQGDA